MNELDQEEALVAAQVSERKEQALKKDLFTKVKTVAEVLGKESKSRGYIPESGLGGGFFVSSLTHQFNTRNLRVEYDRTTYSDKSGSEFTVVLENKLIRKSCLFWMTRHFGPGESHHGIEVSNYIPGKWEEELNTLYTQALATQEKWLLAQKEEERQERQRKILEQKSNFGL
jgi:hypothetical protein